jgi:hypothetical protein
MSYDTQHNGEHNEALKGGGIGQVNSTGVGGLLGLGGAGGSGEAGARADMGGRGGSRAEGGGVVEQTGAGSAELSAKEYPEPMVARVVGLRRGQLKALRDGSLVKGDDWGLINSVVTYSATGVKKLLSAAGLENGDFRWPDPPGVPGMGSAETGGTVEAGDPVGEALEVAAEVVVTAGPRVVGLRVRKLCRNPTILYAEEAEGGPELTVRVRTNGNFLPGMLVQAQEPTTPGGIWHMIGACPRWKGRY